MAGIALHNHKTRGRIGYGVLQRIQPGGGVQGRQAGTGRQRYYWAEFLRLHIRIRRKRGELDAQQTARELESARQVAIAMQSRAAEMRIVTDLAVAQAAAGDPASACAVLESFLAGYPEGRDTADWKRAGQTLSGLKSNLPRI